MLQELDSQSQQTLEEIDKRSKIYLRNSRKIKERNIEEEKSIKADLKKVLELGDEKVALAVQTYDLVSILCTLEIEFRVQKTNKYTERLTNTYAA